MVGGNVDHIHRRDLYSAARLSRSNCLITVVTPAVYPRFIEHWAHTVTTAERRHL